MAAANTNEQSTLSSYQSNRVTSLHLDWNVDFSLKQLKGRVRYDLVGVKTASEVILDTNHLVILGASVAGAPAEFTLAAAIEPFGRALTIRLPAALHEGETTSVEVEYHTTEGSLACQWLTPEQTAGQCGARMPIGAETKMHFSGFALSLRFRLVSKDT